MHSWPSLKQSNYKVINDDATSNSKLWTEDPSYLCPKQMIVVATIALQAKVWRPYLGANKYFLTLCATD